MPDYATHSSGHNRGMRMHAAFGISRCAGTVGDNGKIVAVAPDRRRWESSRDNILPDAQTHFAHDVRIAGHNGCRQFKIIGEVTHIVIIGHDNMFQISS